MPGSTLPACQLKIPVFAPPPGVTVIFVPRASSLKNRDPGTLAWASNFCSTSPTFRVKTPCDGPVAIVTPAQSNDPDRLAKLDAEYLALRTIPLDLKIILSTAIGHGQGDKVR